jgi:DNA invertase Pin-like site-specific DNA recombinase
MDRPQWKSALAKAKEMSAQVIVKSLSRLGRDASAVISTLNTEKIIVADKGMECDRLTLNLLAVIDQNERERISQRTKEGLARAKANGVVLGNPNWEEGLAKGRQTSASDANEFAYRMVKIIGPLRDNGLSFGLIADTLNQSSIPTRRGGRWTGTTVRNILVRWEKMK